MVALHAVIVVLLVGSAFAQTVMVAMPAGAIGKSVLTDRHTQAFVFVGLGIVTVQVVLVCVWRLVAMARRRTVFSRAALRYVHPVVGALVAAALLMVALGVLLAPGETVPRALCSCWAGLVWRFLGSRSSCCGCCSPRPSQATSRRRGWGLSWPEVI